MMSTDRMRPAAGHRGPHPGRRRRSGSAAPSPVRRRGRRPRRSSRCRGAARSRPGRSRRRPCPRSPGRARATSSTRTPSTSIAERSRPAGSGLFRMYVARTPARVDITPAASSLACHESSISQVRIAESCMLISTLPSLDQPRDLWLRRQVGLVGVRAVVPVEVAPPGPVLSEEVLAGLLAVVCGQHDQGLVEQPVVLQPLDDPPHLLVGDPGQLGHVHVLSSPPGTADGRSGRPTCGRPCRSRRRSAAARSSPPCPSP